MGKQRSGAQGCVPDRLAMSDAESRPCGIESTPDSPLYSRPCARSNEVELFQNRWELEILA